MLRRDPTPITLRDTDVQDVREMMAKLAKAKAEADGTTPIPTPTAQNAAAPVVHPEDAKKKREAMTREERLGIA